MSYEGQRKGKAFEDQIEAIFKDHSIEYRKQEKIKGYGKKWRVDFYLPYYHSIVECKSSTGKYLKTRLRLDCLKFLDIHNHIADMHFVLVFPTLQIKIRSFARFCTKYNIKLVLPSNIVEALWKDTPTVNQNLVLMESEKRVIEREQKIMAILELKDGLNANQVAEKLGIKVSLCYLSLRKLEKSRNLIGILKGSSHQDKRYYRRTFKL